MHSNNEVRRRKHEKDAPPQRHWLALTLRACCTTTHRWARCSRSPRSPRRASARGRACSCTRTRRRASASCRWTWTRWASTCSRSSGTSSARPRRVLMATIPCPALAGRPRAAHTPCAPRRPLSPRAWRRSTCVRPAAPPARRAANASYPTLRTAPGGCGRPVRQHASPGGGTERTARGAAARAGSFGRRGDRPPEQQWPDCAHVCVPVLQPEVAKLLLECGANKDLKDYGNHATAEFAEVFAIGKAKEELLALLAHY